MKQSCIVLRASGKKNLLISFASCTIVIWIILMINKLCKTTRNTSSLMYEIILMYRKTIMKIHRTLRLSGFTLYQMGPIDSWDFSNDCLRFFRCCSRLFSCVQSFCPSEILRILSHLCRDGDSFFISCFFTWWYILAALSNRRFRLP